MAKNKKTIENTVDSKVLVEPWITEASTRAADLNKYVFKVATKSSKNDVKKAVEGIYNVSVVSVNTVNVLGKRKTRGGNEGWRTGYKKAIITLKEGNSIEFFEEK
jgi:large subunit ribosomal protein L23